MTCIHAAKQAFKRSTCFIDALFIETICRKLGADQRTDDGIRSCQEMINVLAGSVLCDQTVQRLNDLLNNLGQVFFRASGFSGPLSEPRFILLNLVGGREKSEDAGQRLAEPVASTITRTVAAPVAMEKLEKNAVRLREPGGLVRSWPQTTLSKPNEYFPRRVPDALRSQL